MKMAWQGLGEEEGDTTSSDASPDVLGDASWMNPGLIIKIAVRSMK